MGYSARCTARRRRLGTALRTLREAANVTMEEAAKAIHGERTKISRQETGRHGVTQFELEALFTLYEPKDEKLLQWLVALSDESSKRVWWRQYSKILTDDFKEMLALESEAARISAFQPRVIPGLLQTQAYAATIIADSSDGLGQDELDRFVDVRMSRQGIFLRGDPPRYVTILTEGAIRQQIGNPEAMSEQLRHLVALSQTPEVELLVIPYSQGTYAKAEGSFVLYSYPTPLSFDVVQVPYLLGSLYLEEDEVVGKYQRAFEKLRASALSVRQSVELVSSVADEFERG
ncbi:DNA-binding protein [Streptomyces griseocarneus]|nr:DNA-binding protein [Streptomyces griseocarneus]